MIKKAVFLSLFYILFSLFNLTPVHAQLEIADSYDISDTKVTDGDVLVMTDKGLARTDREYDTRMFGVYTKNPLLSYKRVDGTGLPVTRSGKVMMNVSTINGDIKAGDFVTTSEVLGKAQKAMRSGYIIGVAIDSFSSKDGTKQSFQSQYGAKEKKDISVGSINVAIRIEYAELTTARSTNRLLEQFNIALFRNIQDPERFVVIVRYVGAGLAVLVSFIIGFLSFARSVPKGIEAMGRNPLARNAIQFSIIMNIFFTIVIGIAGITAAIILLKI